MSRKSKRKEMLRLFASENGYAFQEKDQSGLIKYFGNYKLFKGASSRSLKNIVINTNDSLVDQQFGSVEYTYVVSTGKTTMVFEQTVYFHIDKSQVMPQFRLFPEKWYHGIGKWFGMQDINFAEFPEFSQKFVLQSDDEDYTRHLFTNSELIAFLKQYPDWWVEGVGYYMILYRPNKILAPELTGDLFRHGAKLNKMLRSSLGS